MFNAPVKCVLNNGLMVHVLRKLAAALFFLEFFANSLIIHVEGKIHFYFLSKMETDMEMKLVASGISASVPKTRCRV